MKKFDLLVLAILVMGLGGCQQPASAKDDATKAEIAEAKKQLEVGFALGDSATSVTGNLTLATSAASGVTISWASSASGTVSASGVVTRPTGADVVVTLTATLTKGSLSDTKAFTLTVKAIQDTTAADVAAAKSALALTFSTGDSATSVTGNLTLATSAASGVTISWASSASGTVSASGVVTRPAAGQSDVSVTLTATLTKGVVSDTQAFTITVKALPASTPASPSVTTYTLSKIKGDTTSNVIAPFEVKQVTREYGVSGQVGYYKKTFNAYSFHGNAFKSNSIVHSTGFTSADVIIVDSEIHTNNLTMNLTTRFEHASGAITGTGNKVNFDVPCYDEVPMTVNGVSTVFKANPKPPFDKVHIELRDSADQSVAKAPAGCKYIKGGTPGTF